MTRIVWAATCALSHERMAESSRGGVFANRPRGIAVPCTFESSQSPSTNRKPPSEPEAGAVQGGRVIDTDLYALLKPGWFAVVRGPYADQARANAALKSLSAYGGYEGAFVQDAGTSILHRAGVDRGLPVGVLESIIGELIVTAVKEQGSAHGCEPQEPYTRIELSWATVGRQLNEATGSIDYVPKLSRSRWAASLSSTALG